MASAGGLPTNSHVIISGIRYFIALQPLKRQCGNTTSRNQKLNRNDSNKKINTKTDNKAEDNKNKKKEIINIPRELFVCACVCRLFPKKKDIVERKRMKDRFLRVCALFKMGIKCNCKQTERKEN